MNLVTIENYLQRVLFLMEDYKNKIHFDFSVNPLHRNLVIFKSTFCEITLPLELIDCDDCFMILCLKK